MLARYRVNRAGEASSRRAGRGRPSSRTRRRAAHPDDPGPDLGPRGGPVVPSYSWLACCGLASCRVSDVAHVLAVDGGELGGDHDLVGAARVEQPPGQDDGPLDGPGHLVVAGGNPVLASGQLVTERERRPGTWSARRLRAAPDLVPVEARLVGQHGGGRGQRAGPEPVERGLAAARARDGRQEVAVARAMSRASTSSDRQRRRTSRRSQVSVISTYAPHHRNRRSQ